MPECGFACIGLDQAKSPINVSSALRAAQCYGARMLAVSGTRAVRAPTDTMAAHRSIPTLRVDDLRTVVPFNCVPVAVDLVEGAKPLPDYTHPERAFYVFGAEDQTLGRRVLDWCRDVVYVPTNGCMNLAAAVNVVLYDRLAKGAKDA